MSAIKQQFVEVVLMRLRAELLEHKTIIDAYLDSPLTSIKDDVYFNDIVEHTKAMALLENAYRVVQGTYLSTPEPVSEEPAPAPITEEELSARSPTFRRSQAGKGKKKKAADK